jgi:hypothetical protein
MEADALHDEPSTGMTFDTGERVEKLGSFHATSIRGAVRLSTRCTRFGD